MKLSSRLSPQQLRHFIKNILKGPKLAGFRKGIDNQ